jgi:hypothetical protein
MGISEKVVRFGAEQIIYSIEGKGEQGWTKN